MGRLTALRGEIWLADLGIAQKIRPVLILSVAYNDSERALVSYVVRTTSLRDTQYEVAHQAPKFQPGAFDVQSIGSIPDVKLIRRMTVCAPETLQKVESAIKRWLSLS